MLSALPFGGFGCALSLSYEHWLGLSDGSIVCPTSESSESLLDGLTKEQEGCWSTSTLPVFWSTSYFELSFSCLELAAGISYRALCHAFILKRYIWTLCHSTLGRYPAILNNRNLDMTMHFYSFHELLHYHYCQFVVHIVSDFNLRTTIRILAFWGALLYKSPLPVNIYVHSWMSLTILNVTHFLSMILA